MDALAVEVAQSTPEELGALTQRDADKWGHIIEDLGITAE